ncbi:MAG: flavodoxin [Leptolinea sp.]|nr:flavodoxin [Leptolinea sp.]
MGKSLVVYYSLFGMTKKVAVEIASQTEGYIIRLQPEKEYSFDYNTAAKEARNQIDRGYCPKLLNEKVDISQYDTVFLGTPNWFKRMAPPVLSFLRTYDLSNKQIIPFCTHGGGGMGEIENEIRNECQKSRVLIGIAIRDEEISEIIAVYLKNNSVS